MNLIEKHTLVLNKHWIAINTVPVRKALKMVIAYNAEIVDPETSQKYNWIDWSKLEVPEYEVFFINTAHKKFRVPKVIVLNYYAEYPKCRTSLTKKNIFKRDQYRCCYCGDAFSTNELSLEHILPKSRGGKTSWENCVSSCIKCNGKKGDKTPEEANMKLLVNPKKPPMNFFRFSLEKCESYKDFIDASYFGNL